MQTKSEELLEKDRVLPSEHREILNVSLPIGKPVVA